MEMQNQIKEYVALYESEVRKLADQLRNEKHATANRGAF